MYEELFSSRLSELRTQRNISARDMSLSLGQNPGYINNIETGKALPSMTTFFYICEFLKITPSEFFDYDNIYPVETRELTKNIKKLNNEQIKSILLIINDLAK